ncbi:hypothetical protein [Spirosoma rhododendri]|uniref:Uncharacterized protein n=1 Tax=Spirosoma rhododendri TaxID=2728024 RepID=A0A7L5DN33_9BACT|nr:hypothetical protein [Spirosoma rhododendri]QJD79894.1 hypothetical protein HH216_16835 [Spirosoma rhododendri]
MRGNYLPLVFYLSFALSGYAQSSNEADSVAAKPVVYYAESYDTLQAVRQLFAAKRDGAGYAVNVGLLTVGVAGVFVIPTVALVNLVSGLVGTKPDPGRIASFTLQLASPGLLITTFGLVKRIRYNRKREEAVLLAYEQGQPLPPAILRSLTKQYRRTHR